MAVENSLRKSFYNWEIDVYKFLCAVGKDVISF